jgi:hypothetical protein
MQRQGDLHRDRISAFGIFDPQSRRRPPSPTPASSPTASPHLRDVAGLTIRSSKVWSVSAPRYFFFFTAFRFAGAFFFAAGFALAFVAFFAMVPS